MFSRPLALAPRLSTVLLASLLAACGGGGGGGSTTTTPPDPVVTTPAQLTGVAAFGAPLTGATLKVIDAQGIVVGTAATSAADGSYALTLSTATPKLPLMLQAAGNDATGQPLLLHSALAVLNASSAVVNITPLTEAALALTLGTEPRKVFAQPAAYAAQWASLAKLGPASDFVKTLVKTNLTDAKAGTAATLDLFSDSGFSAAKSGVDLALETLSISIGSSSRGSDQLQLTNKLGSTLIEVTVDLASARTELTKTTGATPANAITSTLKATTSPTPLAPKLAALDQLAVAVNNAIAEGGSGSLTDALTTKYITHNGRNASALKDLVADWAVKNMQMGRLQVTGCADDPFPAKGCAKLAVAAHLNDAKGEQAGSFSDVVSLLSPTATPPTWVLVGNGQAADAAVHALAWLKLGADGSRPAGAAVNPQLGVQLAVQSNVSSAKVQTPSGNVFTLASCGQALFCIATTPGASSTLATGTLADQGVFQASNGWLAIADLAAGARYSVTPTPASTPTVRTATLRSGFVAAPADNRFPVIDGVKAAQPLTSAALLDSNTLAWSAWAAANPDMRVTQVRLVLAGATASDTPLIFEATPLNWRDTQLAWPVPDVPADFPGSAITLWIGAIDATGRLYYTSYEIVAATPL